MPGAPARGLCTASLGAAARRHLFLRTTRKTTRDARAPGLGAPSRLSRAPGRSLPTLLTICFLTSPSQLYIYFNHQSR